MIRIRYDGVYKGNIYTLYGDGWCCTDSKSSRYRWLKPCVMVQRKLDAIATSQGYCINPKPVIKEEEKKKPVSNKTSKKATKVTSKTFISLF